MPHSFGLRARTRDLFSKPFKKHGAPNMSTYLTVFKRGDYVDIATNGAIHKGMPSKQYHGKTGRIWNVTKRAVGVEINKTVRQRIFRKRFHVRVEHIIKSKCRDEYLKRKKERTERIAKAKANNGRS